MNTRIQISEEIVGFLSSQGIDLKEKSVLDVGSRTGENAFAMKQRGAAVTVCDPDTESLKKGVESGYLEEDDVRFGILQDFETEFEGKFDVVTCFMWNIPFAEREAFTEELCKALKPGGKIVIGLVDDAYINDPHGAAVQPLMNRYCHTANAVPNAGGWNRCFLVCSDPRQEPLPKSASTYGSSGPSGRTNFSSLMTFDNE